MAAEIRKLRLWQGRVQTEVAVQGSGPALVYLHGPWGLRHDEDFLARLAASHTVYAPKHPGTTNGDPEAVHQLDDWLDLMVYYGELFDALKLATPSIIGHSFGGMVAAEIAAALPGSVSKLVLIDAAGLWRDDLPVRNWMVLSDADRRWLLFADPDGPVAKRFFSVPDDPSQRVETIAGTTWALACTGKFVWPIPDRGLKKRIHRIAAPTQIVWGKADGILAPPYAQEFASRIKGARVEVIDGAGHLPHLEKAEPVARVVQDFLKG